MLEGVETLFLWSSPHEPSLLEAVYNRGSHCVEVLNESTVKSSKAVKATQLMDISWCGPLFNGSNLLVIHMYTLGTDHVAEKQNLLGEKTTLLRVYVELVLSKSVENLLQML